MAKTYTTKILNNWNKEKKSTKQNNNKTVLTQGKDRIILHERTPKLLKITNQNFWFLNVKKKKQRKEIT